MKLFNLILEELNEAENIVVLTGAGVSTDSGIPDFRSESGTYSRWDSSRVFDINYFYSNPEYFFQYAREELYNFDDIKPNKTHYFLQHLEEMGRLKAIITQNIDMLHQRSGSETVYEIHGSIKNSHCLNCGAYYEYEFMKDIVMKAEIPRCSCGGIIKPDIVFFGESLPEREINASVACAHEADLFITMGTSLFVYPAASLPTLAKESGATIAIINRDPTPLDQMADFVIREELSEVVSQLNEIFF